MNSEKIFIFDFDGTLADSTEVVVKILNNLAPEFGVNPAPDSEVQRLRKLSTRELIKEFKVPIYMVPFIFRRFKQEMKKAMPEIKPISGIPQVLRQLHGKKQKLYIISSNTTENINLFLARNGIEYFDRVIGDAGLFGKNVKIKRIIKNENLDPGKVFYFGDETRDIESARKAGVKSVAVVWGIGAREALERENPDFIFSKPEELLSL